MLRAAVALLVWTGCNQIYGIEATHIIDASPTALDQDRDGVIDSADNCVEIANPAQTNTDGDAVGDACDPCSFAFNPALDRDADGLVAADDNCPAVSNAAQTDTDRDGVGDACDPNVGTADAVRCYADVATETARAWNLTGPWKVLGTDASAIITHSPATTPPFWLGAVASGLAPSNIAIQVDTVPPSTPTPPNVAAIGVAVAAGDESAFAACELVRADTALRLRVADAAGGDEIALQMSAQRMYVTLEYRRSAASVELRCTSSLADGTREQVTRTTTTAIEPSVLYVTSTNTTGTFRAITLYDTN